MHWPKYSFNFRSKTITQLEVTKFNNEKRKRKTESSAHGKMVKKYVTVKLLLNVN